MAESNAVFGSWLQKTRVLQVESFGRDEHALATDPALLADTVGLNFKDLVVELGEMMGEYPGHKSWVTHRDIFFRDEFLEEAVDALHFFANILTALGYTDEELTWAYEHKMAKNAARMASRKYDGVNHHQEKGT